MCANWFEVFNEKLTDKQRHDDERAYYCARWHKACAKSMLNSILDVAVSLRNPRGIPSVIYKLTCSALQKLCFITCARLSLSDSFVMSPLSTAFFVPYSNSVTYSFSSSSTITLYVIIKDFKISARLQRNVHQKSVFNDADYEIKTSKAFSMSFLSAIDALQKHLSFWFKGLDIVLTNIFYRGQILSTRTYNTFFIFWLIEYSNCDISIPNVKLSAIIKVSSTLLLKMKGISNMNNQITACPLKLIPNI